MLVPSTGGFSHSSHTDFCPYEPQECELLSWKSQYDGCCKDYGFKDCRKGCRKKKNLELKNTNLGSDIFFLLYCVYVHRCIETALVRWSLPFRSVRLPDPALCPLGTVVHYPVFYRKPYLDATLEQTTWANKAALLFRLQKMG